MGMVGARLRDMIEFFKQNKGFHRLLADMSAMYAQHGRTYGAVRLANPTREEEQAISAFFQRDYFDQALIRISLGDFERQLKKVFPSAKQSLEDFNLLMAEYTHTGNVVHKSKNTFADEIINNLLPKYKNTPAAHWLNDVIACMRRTYKPWVKQYTMEPSKVLNIIDKVAELLNNLPTSETPVQLTTFAAKFLDSPYKLDIDGEYGSLFLSGLAYYFGTPVPSGAESAVGLYLKAGLLTNGALCQVTVQNIDGYTSEGMQDQVCAIYNRLGQAHVLTLENIAQFSRAKSIGGKVFIIENPFVFSAVRERLHDVKCTMISPMGNSNPAFIKLLKLLRASGDQLYYAGNLDYKGLIQADNLYLMFGKNLIPWRYSKADYELALSKNILLGEKKDLAMHNEDLALVLSQMRKTGKAANSMALVPLLVEDVKNIGGVQ